ncbi:MAG: XdhC family protein [Acidobacteria bacterium]|nr:XdhC family protein [Acidobacteriota bacterium]
MTTDALQSLVARVDRGEAAVLATIVAGAGAGRRIVTDGEGRLEATTGDGVLDAAISSAAVESLRRRKPATFTHHSPGGDLEIFVEPYEAPLELIVCGAGHIAIPLCRAAAFAGYRVTVIDDRADYASRKRFPDAAEVLADDFEPALLRTRVTASTAIVLITRGHRYDWDCVRAVGGRPAFYIGMIGSRRRVQAARLGLEAEGVPRDVLDRMYAPIGLDIGAQTPEEIAIAIMAEIIMVRSGGGTARPISEIARRAREEHGGA